MATKQSKPVTFEINPADGGHLRTRISSERAGALHFTVKRDWRRDAGCEVKRVGHDYFWPFPAHPIEGQAIPYSNGEPITLIHQLPPNQGQPGGIIIATKTEIKVNVDPSGGPYFEISETPDDAYVEQDPIETHGREGGVDIEDLPPYEEGVYGSAYDDSVATDIIMGGGTTTPTTPPSGGDPGAPAGGSDEGDNGIPPTGGTAQPGTEELPIDPDPNVITEDVCSAYAWGWEIDADANRIASYIALTNSTAGGIDVYAANIAEVNERVAAAIQARREEGKLNVGKPSTYEYRWTYMSGLSTMPSGLDKFAYNIETLPRQYNGCWILCTAITYKEPTT